jgi:AcrR family transcriptional regulator
MSARASERAVLSPAALEPGAGESLRERIMEAMLTACGERGFRDVAVKDVLEIYGGHRVQFWQQFADKDECFAAAYEAWIERLSARLLGAAVAEPGRRDGLRAALVELFRFVNERPAIARSLFVEVRIAGGAALTAHEAVAERCARAIDGARGDAAPEEAPPPLTGAFVVGGIENCVCDALAAGEPRRLWEELPELMHFAVAPYFGERAAEEEFVAAREAAERELDRAAGADARP